MKNTMTMNLLILLLSGTDPHKEQDFDEGDDVGFWLVGASCRRKNFRWSGLHRSWRVKISPASGWTKVRSEPSL